METQEKRRLTLKQEHVKFVAIGVVALVLAAVIGAIWSGKAPENRGITPVALSMPESRPIAIPKETKVGMSYSEFSLLCGGMDYGRYGDDGDDMRTIETVTGKTVVYDYKSRHKTRPSTCQASFTFNDGILVSIYRR